MQRDFRKFLIDQYGRTLLDNVWSTVKKRTTVTVEIKDPKVLEWFSLWLSDKQYMGKCRVLSAETLWNDDEDFEDLYYSPGGGKHILKYNGRLFLIERYKEKLSKGVQTELAAFLDKEIISVSTFGNDMEPIKEMINSARVEFKAKQKDKVSIYFMTEWGEWNRINLSNGRSLDSVILAGDTKELLLADLSTFLSKKSWYEGMGIPYRRGYLLYGPAGTGKSSLVKAISTHLGLSLYVVPLSLGISDARLTSGLANTNPNSIILFEDIDSLFNKREKKEKETKVTFSGLINALDGVAAQEGRVVIMTTNHLENLDEALIRDGRADLRLEIGLAKSEQVEKLFLRFYPQAPQLAKVFAEKADEKPMVPSQLQNYFMKRNVTEAIHDMNLLYGKD